MIDYDQLLTHLINKLKEMGATDVISEIQEVATRKVTEITDLEQGSRNFSMSEVPLFNNYNNPQAIRSIHKQNPTKKLIESRILTSEEIFDEAIEIMQNYVLLPHKMALRVAEVFSDNQSEKEWNPKDILWDIDTNMPLLKSKISSMKDFCISNEELSLLEEAFTVLNQASQRRRQ